MGGGLMQLVAYGAQDIYLTGNPQITFFKVVYRRHTNFSMEAIQQTIQGSSTISPTSESNGTVTLSRNGDLVSKIYACFTVGGISKTGLNQCDRLLKNVDLEIGGQLIDRHPLKWMQIWNELTISDDRVGSFQHMTGLQGRSLTTGGNNLTGIQNLVQIPLLFWFCRNPGLALPLIALQYHEVKMKFTWGTSNDAVYHGGAEDTTDTPNCEVWVDYIYLDTDERRRFAQVSHEYLIEQVQVMTGKVAKSHTLNFNHPVKELIWLNNSHLGSNKTHLELNGHERFAPQFKEYFQYRQPYDYHARTPHGEERVGDLMFMNAKRVDLGTSAEVNTFKGVEFNTGLTTTRGLVAGTTVGFCCVNDTGSAAAYGGDIKGIILDPDLDIAAGELWFLDFSKSEHSDVIHLMIRVKNFAVGLLTFDWMIMLPGTDTSISQLNETTSASHRLQLRHAIGPDSFKPTIKHAFGGNTSTTATVNKFTAVNSDGTNVTPDDGRSLVLPTNLNIHASEIHRVIHTDMSAITSATTHSGGHKETLAHVESYNHKTGLIRYDKQVIVSLVATEAVDILHISVIGVGLALVGPSSLPQHINVYSFALKPEEHQPSGTCNFSRIDNAQLKFDASVEIDSIYAVNYNVLRIMSGMGGLAYSN
jgi:hypothetical protein